MLCAIPFAVAAKIVPSAESARSEVSFEGSPWDVVNCAHELPLFDDFQVQFFPFDKHLQFFLDLARKDLPYRPRG